MAERFYDPDILVHCQGSHADRMLEYATDIADRLGSPILEPYKVTVQGSGGSALVAVRFKGHDGERMGEVSAAGALEGVASLAAYPTPMEAARDRFLGVLGTDPSVGSALLGLLPCDAVVRDAQAAMDAAAALAQRVREAVDAGRGEAAPPASVRAGGEGGASVGASSSAGASAAVEETEDGDPRPVVVTRVQAWPRDVADGVLAVLLEELPSPWKAGLLRPGEAASPAVDNKRFVRPLARHPAAAFSSVGSAAPARLYTCRHSFRAVVGVAFHARSGKWSVGACLPAAFVGHFAQRRELCRPVEARVPVCGAFWKLREALSRMGWPLRGPGRAEAAARGDDKERGSSMVPALRLAVDAGASPGGWSQCLVVDAGCETVLAVDPGSLSPALPRGVTHMRCLIEEALPRIIDERGRGALDAWVTDMNTRPAEAALQVVEAAAAGLLRRGALVVVTLKQVAGTTVYVEQEVPQAVRALSSCCLPGSVRVRRLFANKRESTLMALAAGEEACAAAAEEAARLRSEIDGSDWGTLARAMRAEAAASGSARAANKLAHDDAAAAAAGDKP